MLFRINLNVYKIQPNVSQFVYKIQGKKNAVFLLHFQNKLYETKLTYDMQKYNYLLQKAKKLFNLLPIPDNY